MTYPENALAEFKSFRVDLKDEMRGNIYREGILIKGEYGWAEFAPFANHSIEHSARWLQACLEMAWTKLPEPKATEVAVNAINTSKNPLKAIEMFQESGCKTLKVKLDGQNLLEEIDFLNQINNLSKQEIKLRIDFNGALAIESAKEYLNNLTDFDIEYIEQPCSTLNEIESLKKITDIPIAIDESLRLTKDSTEKDFLNKISEIADFVILKPIPLGGIKRFLDIANYLSGKNIKVVVSGSMDTSLGLYETTLAQTLINDSSSLVCGAGTGALLLTDVVSKTLKPKNGKVEVIKLDLDESKLQQSPNEKELFKKMNECYDFGKVEGWF